MPASSRPPPFRPRVGADMTPSCPSCALALFCPSHEWTKVSIGVWQKYPNPSAAHVTCVDTIDRTVDPETGIIRT